MATKSKKNNTSKKNNKSIAHKALVQYYLRKDQATTFVKDNKRELATAGITAAVVSTIMEII